MRLPWILCLAALLCLPALPALADPAPGYAETAGPLLAQGKKSRKKSPKKRKPSKGGSKGAGKKAPGGGGGSSAAAPTDNASFGAAVRAGYMYIGPGFGAEGFYILNPDIQIGGQFLYKPSSEVKAEGDALFLEYASIAATSFGARARYFVYGSLFLLGGLTMDQVSGKYGFTETSSGKLYYTDYSATAIMLQLGVGNIWRFGSFLVGADWITATLPVSLSASAVEEEVLDEEGARPTLDPLKSEGKELNPTIVEALKKQLQFQAVMVYAGMTF